MAGGTASQQKIAIAERRKMALDLRKQGGSYRQIAESLREVEGMPVKYSAMQAQRDVTDELRRYNEANKESAGIIKRLELERLDELWQPYWTAAIAGDVTAGQFILRLMERRARLEGLDAPVAVKHSGDAEHPVQVESRVAVEESPNDLLITVGTLETAGVVPVGTVAALYAALVALYPDLAPPETAGLPAAELP